MAIIVPQVDGATYVRVGGYKIGDVPEVGLSLVRRRIDGEWWVRPDRPVQIHLYGYADLASREAKAPPVWARDMLATVADLSLVEAVPGTSTLAAGPVYAPVQHTPESLQTAVYAAVKAIFPDAIDDMQTRFPV